MGTSVSPCLAAAQRALLAVRGEGLDTIRVGGIGYVHAVDQGLTLVHFSAQPKPFWSHLPVSPCLKDWGKFMQPTYPTKCAYVEPKSGRVSAPAVDAAGRPLCSGAR